MKQPGSMIRSVKKAGRKRVDIWGQSIRRKDLLRLKQSASPRVTRALMLTKYQRKNTVWLHLSVAPDFDKKKNIFSYYLIFSLLQNFSVIFGWRIFFWKKREIEIEILCVWEADKSRKNKKIKNGKNRDLLQKIIRAWEENGNRKIKKPKLKKSRTFSRA